MNSLDVDSFGLVNSFFVSEKKSNFSKDSTRDRREIRLAMERIFGSFLEGKGSDPVCPDQFYHLLRRRLLSGKYEITRGVFETDLPKYLKALYRYSFFGVKMASILQEEHVSHEKMRRYKNRMLDPFFEKGLEKLLEDEGLIQKKVFLESDESASEFEELLGMLSREKKNVVGCLANFEQKESFIDRPREVSGSLGHFSPKGSEASFSSAFSKDSMSALDSSFLEEKFWVIS